MKISACLIVKNEEKVLEMTLPTLKEGVDEIILVDTGSSDRTVEIAEKYGAKVYHFAWIDDFSAARNESLKYAGGDWVIWVDADEFIRSEDLSALRKTLEASQEEAYLLPISECPLGTTEGSSFYFRVKAFKNGCGIHFEREFNEQVYRADGRLLETKAFLPSVKIYHWGRNLSKETMQGKKERNFRILEEVLQKNPQDAHYHFLLANNYADVGEKGKAAEEYGKVIELDSGALAAASRVKRARILVDDGHYDEAYELLKTAAAVQPWNAEVFNLIAIVYLSIGNTEKAVQVLEHSRQLTPPQNYPMGIDLTQFGYFPNYLLGNASLLSGDKKKALEAFKSAYALNPEAGLRSKIENLEKEVDSNV